MVNSQEKPFNIRDVVSFDRNGRAYCPSCEQKKGRRPSQKSLAVLESGAYKCHAGCTSEEIRVSLGVPKHGSTPLSAKSQLHTAEQITKAMAWLLQGRDEDSQWAQQWLDQRGITSEIARHYCLGLVNRNGTTGVSIPIPADESSQTFYQKLRLEPWIGNTAWTQKGMPAMVYFTHKPDQAKQTYLCEGEWDAILLGWAMREATDTAIATFTCGCNVIPCPEQLQRLPGKVFIFYDRDEPGQQGAEKLARVLGDRGWIAQVPCSQASPPKGWDISDALNAGLTVEAIRTAARIATRAPGFELTQPTSRTRLNYEQCLNGIDEILLIEDTARQLWELNLLAKQAELSTAQLRKIHQTRLECARVFSPIDVVDFLAKAPEKREWIIAGKIPRGSTIALIADGGTGKSRLSYDLAYAIASGQPWNGFRTTQGKVLIIQTDEPDVDFSDSLRDANYETFDRGLVQVETEWQFSQIPQLTRWVEQEQPLLVIIDSFTAANRASDLDEKDTNYGACIYDLRNIANTHGCTFLILHHTNKLGESRGTTAIPDNVSEVWYLRHPKSEDNLPGDRRIWSIEKSRSRCSGKFAIGFDPDECVVVYHGEHQSTPSGQGNLEARLLEHFQQFPTVPFEIEELAGQFNSSQAHVRRLVKRLWRQGHISEETREVSANNGRGGRSRKKVFVCPGSDDQVTKTQAGPGSLSLDHDLPKDDQVTQPAQNQGFLSLDHPICHTRDPSSRASGPLKVGDWVEILTGYFSGRQVEVVDFPSEKPGWVEVKGKTWAITQQYQQCHLQRVRRVQG
ncbi:MAG: AAA family ATPase [Aphanocapsa sp. GSE-SYN-MK-11-07L]|nr:AAA family ATPase [Aphanocapsa sp. GSE-SYN-MK-11-07L]